jgi:hypothetical protein
MCTTPSGARVPNQFALTYVEDGNLLGAPVGTGGHDSAYARVRHDADTDPRFAFPGDGSVRAELLTTGRYRVRMPVDLSSGHAQVTATGFPPGRFCKVAWWNSLDGIVVHCFGADGRPANVDFQVTFVGPSRS